MSLPTAARGSGHTSPANAQSLVLATADAIPTIQNVSITGSTANYSLSVRGVGFGAAPSSMPYTGTSHYFRIGENAQFGHGEWGYVNDSNRLRYVSWNDSTIDVSGLAGSPGDALLIGVWNPITGVGAVWGGNLPNGTTAAPVIRAVSVNLSGHGISIQVNGSGFGPSPATLPFNGTLDYFWFIDAASHCGAASSKFEAGFSSWGVYSPENITMNFTAWSSTSIRVTGFGGAYGTGCAQAAVGDPIAISVWNTTDSSLTGPQTAWGGRIGNVTAPLNVSVAVAPSVGAAPLNVSVNATVGGGTGPFSFNWSFGDGSVGSGRSAGHVFQQSGTFSILLVVADGLGAVVQRTAVVTVIPSAEPSNASLQIGVQGNPVTGAVGLISALAATAHGGLPPYSYAWNFGDGSEAQEGATVGHTFATAGVFAVTVAVHDSSTEPLRAIAGLFVTVGQFTCSSGSLPIVVVGSALSGPAPLQVQLTPFTPCGVPPYHLEWSFGDNTPSAESSVLAPAAHTYVENGTFAPTLEIADSVGDHGVWALASANLSIHVFPALAVRLPNTNSSVTPFSWGSFATPALIAGGFGAAFLLSLLLAYRRKPTVVTPTPRRENSPSAPSPSTSESGSPIEGKRRIGRDYSDPFRGII